jgi:hypothetical protein
MAGMMPQDPLVVAHDEAVLRLCRAGDALRPLWQDDVYWPKVRKAADSIGINPMELHNHVVHLSLTLLRERIADEEAAAHAPVDGSAREDH